MSLQTDIQEYKAACVQAADLYAEIGTNRELATAKRPERWAVNKRKREAAENVLMCILGEHRSALRVTGLEKLYDDMAAGRHECDVAMFKIVDETVKHYDSK
jgi:hypothetical protein